MIEYRVLGDYDYGSIYTTRRRKANLWDLLRLGIEYHSFARVKNKEGMKGWRYTLCKSLTDEQREVLGMFKNVVLSSCQHRYAPEIRHDVVILTDKMEV